MALTTGPNMGLLVNGEKGEAHYEALMRFFRGLDTLVQPRVSSMVGALPTTGLTDGLTVVYTGNDANKNRIARYSSVLAGWEYFTPRSGWEIAVVDQIDENGQFKKYQYTGSDWVEKLTAGGLTLAAGDARYERLIKHNLTATTDPTVTDDSTQGYSVLSRWVNTTTKEAFLALDVAPGVANWQQSTLTVDELGTAALAMVGVLDNQLPTVATVKNLLSTLAVFGAGSAASAGTKGLVPAPPQSEVLRFLRSDGVWAFFEIPEGTELSTGANIGEAPEAHGIYFQTVGDTLQFKSLRSANNKLKITSSEGNVTLEVMVEGGSDTNITNVGNGAALFAGMDGSAAKLRTIRAGANMAVEIDGDVLVLTSSGGGEGSGGEGGSASLENVGGGFPLFQKKVTGPSALRTLLPGPGVYMFRTDTTLRIGLDEMRQVPSTNLFAVDGPDGKLWATWDTAADLLTPDDENAWVDVWVERFERESGYSYGFLGGAEYRGQKSMPVLGFQFALTRDAIMRVWVDVLEDGDETGGHFNFAIGSSYDPTQSSQIIAIPAQYDMQWPIEFRLSAYGYEDMLRIEPPAGCQSFNVAIRIEADFTQDGNFVEVAAPLKIESFEGGENDPKVLSNWTEIGTNSSNGWISDSGDYSSPLSPRVRLAFGMVELYGCIRYLGGDSGVGRMAYVDGPFRMRNAREGADIDPYALFPVAVEGPDQNSIAFLRVLPDGGLEISPIPAAGSVVHLSGVRYPLKWPSSLPF